MGLDLSALLSVAAPAKVGASPIGPKGDVFYRYTDVQYAAPLDEYDEPCGGGSLEVELWSYSVLSRTPKGAWLDVHGQRRFVRNEGRKRFALPTIEEARQSFIARKKAQMRIYQAKIDRARNALLAMEKA